MTLHINTEEEHATIGLVEERKTGHQREYVSDMSFSMLIFKTHEQHIKFKSKPEANIEFSGVPVTRVARAAPSAPKHTMV